LKKTSSNIPLKPFYGQGQNPGEYPFTSGIHRDFAPVRKMALVVCLSWFFSNEQLNL
jgi:hypothetical protein